MEFILRYDFDYSNFSSLLCEAESRRIVLSKIKIAFPYQMKKQFNNLITILHNLHLINRPFLFKYLNEQNKKSSPNQTTQLF